MNSNIRIQSSQMDSDSELKLNLHNVVSHAVQRIECASDASIKRCLFQEYKEWLGRNIDDWVLALPNDWRKSE